MVKCSNCGNEIKSGNFCGKCGTKISKNVGITEYKTCPNCRKSVSVGSDFCPACGNNFNEHKTKKCSYCGATIDANIAVCPHCNNRKKFEQQNSNNNNSSPRHKYAWLSAILSFFISGLGQLYNGQYKKALIIFVLFVVFSWFGSIGLFLSYVVRFYATYDGYKTAKRINSGELV